MKKLLFSVFFWALLSPAVGLPAVSGVCGKKVYKNVGIEERLSRSKQQRVRKLLKGILETTGSEVLKKAESDFYEAAELAWSKRSQALKREDAQRDPHWVLDQSEYPIYVDQFGVGQKNGTFKSAQKMLPYLKDLGIDVIYVLPFLESPRQDAGFDQSSWKRVSKELGGDREFDSFLKEARKMGFKLKMDLVINHVSEKHDWFQKLLEGDLSYKDYFITRDIAPDIVKRYKNSEGNFVVYRESDPSGKIVEVTRRLIFPEAANSHYRKIQIPDGRGGIKDLWVYHTFFPFQIDLNFNHPKVIREVYGAISYWSNRGIDMFRLDAIPFLDKSKESHPRTHQVIELMSLFQQVVAPRSTIMVEACQKPEELVKYFGKKSILKHPYTKKIVHRTSEAQMAYDFTGMPNLFASLLSGEARYFVESQKAEVGIPEGAAFARFLRLHDELTLEMATPEVQKVVANALIPTKKGNGFRNDLGVGGRLGDFLDRDPRKMTLAFGTLFGQKGMPIVFYGDEISARRNDEYAKTEARLREKMMEESGIPVEDAYDGRDPGRGPIPAENFYRAMSGPLTVEKVVHDSIKNLLRARKESLVMRRGTTRTLESSARQVASFSRELGGKKVVVVSNFSGGSVNTTVKLKRRASGKGFDLISQRNIFLGEDPNLLSLDLGPYEVLWIEIE